MSVSSPNYKYYKNYTLKKQPTLWFVFSLFFVLLFLSLCLFFSSSLLLLFSCPSPFVITLLEVCVHCASFNAMCINSFVLLSPIFEYMLYVASMPSICIYVVWLCTNSIQQHQKKLSLHSGPRIGLSHFPQILWQNQMHSVFQDSCQTSFATSTSIFRRARQERPIFGPFVKCNDFSRNIIYTLCHSGVLHITIFSLEKKQAATVCCCRCCCCNGSTTNTNDINDIAIIIIITPFNAYCILFCGI